MDEDRLKAAMLRRGDTPDARLLAIFDVLDESFQRRGLVLFPPFTAPRAISSPEFGGPSARSLVEGLATEAGIADARSLAEIWCMLMNGAVIAAHAGDGDAVRKARQAAADVLATWRRGAAE